MKCWALPLVFCLLTSPVIATAQATNEIDESIETGGAEEITEGEEPEELTGTEEVEEITTTEEDPAEENRPPAIAPVPSAPKPRPAQNHQKIQPRDEFVDDEGHTLSELPGSESSRAASGGPAALDPATLQEFKDNGGIRRVDHPMAEKGLMRITKDKIYKYKVAPSPQTAAWSFRGGSLMPKSLTNGAGTSFDSIYTSDINPILYFDYEWQILRTAIGKFGLRLGTGISAASGKGRFVDDQTEAPETYTFLNFPNSVGAVYRMQFWDTQPIVPYAEGGVTGFSFVEIRDDNDPPKFGGSLAAHVALGLAFQLNFLDQNSMLELDREHGINSVYLTVEGRGYQAITTKFDFTSTLIVAGILVEF